MAMVSAVGIFIPGITHWPAPEAKADSAFWTEAPEESREAIILRDRLTGATEGVEAAHIGPAAVVADIVAEPAPPVATVEPPAAVPTLTHLQ